MYVYDMYKEWNWEIHILYFVSCIELPLRYDFKLNFEDNK